MFKKMIPLVKDPFPIHWTFEEKSTDPSLDPLSVTISKNGTSYTLVIPEGLFQKSVTITFSPTKNPNEFTGTWTYSGKSNTQPITLTLKSNHLEAIPNGFCSFTTWIFNKANTPPLSPPLEQH
jgi:hypothetical protein